MRIIGIDPGTHVTGYGLIDVTAEKVCYIEHNVFKARPQDKIAQRLQTIGNSCEKLLAKHQPDVAVLEKSFLGLNANTAIVLGEVRGMFLYLFGKYNIAIKEFDSRVIKKGITGSGNASKEHVRHLILNRFNITNARQLELDATDALSLAFYHGTSYCVRQSILQNP